MIYCLLQQADGSIQSCDDTQQIRAQMQQPDVRTWIDLEAPSEQDVGIISELFGFEAESLEDCLHGEQRPRIDTFEEYIFVMFYAAVGPEYSGTFAPRKLGAFFCDRFLVTVAREPLLTLRTLRERCARQSAHFFGKGLDFIFYSIIDGMVDRYLHVSDEYQVQVDQLEEASLDAEVDESLLQATSGLRRELLELRQIAHSQRELLMPLARGEYEDISPALSMRFRHVCDHLADVVESVDSQRELLHTIRDNYRTAISNRMNKVIKMLTIIATIMLPLSVVAGIYGMNVQLWPPQDQPASFLLILATMALLTVFMLWLFRFKKWL